MDITLPVTLPLIGLFLLALGIVFTLSGSKILNVKGGKIDIPPSLKTTIVGVFFLLVGIVVIVIGLQSDKPSGSTPVLVVGGEATETPILEVEATDMPPLDPAAGVEVEPTATPVEPPISTPIVEPTATPTNIPEPEPPVETAVKLQTITINVIIYSGPSDKNPHMGLVNFNDELEALGKVQGGSWYQVIAESGVTGWVGADQVEFISGSDEDVAITWPLASAGGGPTDTAFNTSACMSTVVERDPVGTVYIKWSNLPDNARWLYLTIRGELGDEMTDLIQPNNRIDVNDNDTAERGFELGSYLFDPDDPSSKGFPTGTIFSYTLQARDAGSEVLCAVSGNF